MFADKTHINFNTSKEAIFMVNNELDVAIISLQYHAAHQHLNLNQILCLDMESPVHIMGYSQETGLQTYFNEFSLAKGVEDEFIFYNASLESQVSGAPVLQMNGKGEFTVVGVHNSYSTKDEFPSMATTVSSIRKWLQSDESSVPDGKKGKLLKLFQTGKYECDDETADEMPCLTVTSPSENSYKSN